jgi:heme-degrading monooxygenase HmoA
MVRATLRIRVRAGQQRRFEAAWRAVADEVRRTPGNLAQALVRADDDDTYVITSDWASRAAFHAFERSPAQDRLTGPLRALRVSADMSVDEIVYRLTGVEPPASHSRTNERRTSA